MRMRLLAAGTRMPAWVSAGYDDYATRLRGDYRLELIEIPLGDRSSGDVRRAVEAEGKRMLAAAGERPYLVALQVGGKALTTGQLARWLEDRAREGDSPFFCIGGPDGLARVVVAEAIYRAVSLIKGLPYHRA